MKTQTVVNTEATRLKTASQQFVALELVTKPTLSTAEYAYYIGIAPQTARIHACKECGPLRPIRLPGSSLLRWSTLATKKLVGVAP